MKRLIVYSLCLLLLCACAPLPVNEASEPPDNGEDETITMISFPDQPKKYFEEAINAMDLDFEVKIMEVPQNQYENKVRMMLSANEAPDLILVDAPNIASYSISGRIEPLDPYWPEESFQDLVESSQSAVTWNGHRWAAPLNEGSCLLFYNRRLLEQEGIRPAQSVEEAWSMEELLDAAIKLTKWDENGDIRQYGLQPTMFSPNNRMEGMAYTQMLYTWWFGADILSPSGNTATGYFDSPANLAALTYFYDLYNTYQVAPLQEIPNGFANEKIAMLISGPWLIGAWRDYFPDFYQDKWGAMPLPKGMQAACPSGSWNIAMTKQCKNKQNAWKVIDAITGEAGMKIWCKGTGNIAARQSVIHSQNMDDLQTPYKIIYDQLAASAFIRPVTPAYPVISEALIDCYNKVAFGESPKKAIDEATERMSEILAEFEALPASQ